MDVRELPARGDDSERGGAQSNGVKENRTSHRARSLAGRLPQRVCLDMPSLLRRAGATGHFESDGDEGNGGDDERAARAETPRKGAQRRAGVGER